jgi:hypothetical protein
MNRIAAYHAPLTGPTEGAPPLVLHPSEIRGTQRSLKRKYAVLGRASYLFSTIFKFMGIY